MLQRRVVLDEDQQEPYPALIDPEQLEVATGGAVLADDPATEGLIAQASATIRGYAGWHIAPVIEETLRVEVPFGGAPLNVLLPSLRVVRVLEVRVDGRKVDQPAWLTDGHVWAGHLSCGPHVIEADVRHGYSLDEVADVQGVAVQVAAVAMSSPTGVTREQTGAVSLEYARTGDGVAGGLALLPRDRDVLDRYRIGSAP